MRRIWLRVVVIVTMGIGLVAVLPATASAQDNEVAEYSVNGLMAADGMLSITETLTFTSAAPDTLVQRLITSSDAMDYAYFRFDYTNIEVTANGSSLNPSITVEDNHQVITIATGGANQIEISYQVAGAAMYGGITEDGTELTYVAWPVLQGLSIPVAHSSGEIRLPGRVISVRCESGAITGLKPCVLWAGGTQEHPNPYFEDQKVGPNQFIVVSFDVPSYQIAINEQLIEQWNLNSSFSREPMNLLVALGVLLIGAVFLVGFHRKVRNTARKSKTIAFFIPSVPGVANFRPGMVGTIADEHVDPLDVAATLVDLAVRGHLLIVELSGTLIDWTFKRLRAPDDLLPYEKTLLDAVAPDGKEVRVSELGPVVTEVIPTVQEQLYDEFIARRWFTRNNWVVVGWVVFGLAVAGLISLVLFTNYGILGLVLIGLALGFLALSQQMPPRTGEGSAIRRGLQLLSVELAKKPESREFSRVLPYAIALGGVQRVLQNSDANVVWYRSLGELPFPTAFDAFLTNLEGRLFSR